MFTTDTPSSEAQPTLYFAYGSNLWLDQMKTHCPESTYIGIASLSHWRWFISSRGYANVTASEGDIVYGAMFELSQEDEARLDRYEGVPNSYVKRIIPVRYLGDEDYGVDQENGHKMVDALVYVDILRPQEGPPKQEYIRRMNCGIRDGIEAGIPKGYITKYIRPFIPKADARPRSTQ